MSERNIQFNFSMFESTNVSHPEMHINYTSDTALTVPDEYPILEDTEYYMNSVVIPTLAVFGVIGNVLNLAVLTCRYAKRETDSGEKGALIGLIALAISDMFFCIGVIPSAFYDGFQVVFYSKSIWLYYEVYGTYYQNVFIKTSTTLTTIIALGRYFGICHPLKLRRCARLIFTKIIIAVTGVFWISFNLPLIWNMEVFTLPAGNGTFMYLIDTGPFSKNDVIKMTFTYLWAIIGYFIPLSILSFCNIQLIRALRRSQKLRQRNARYCNAAAQDHRSRITLTLIALTSMYIVFVSPSEILHFYQETSHSKSSDVLGRAVVCTNALQAVNFSCHFILYCLVNPSFRSIIINAFKKSFLCKGSLFKQPKASNSAESNNSRTQYAHSQSVSTHINNTDMEIRPASILKRNRAFNEVDELGNHEKKLLSECTSL